MRKCILERDGAHAEGDGECHHHHAHCLVEVDGAQGIEPENTNQNQQSKLSSAEPYKPTENPYGTTGNKGDQKPI